MCILKYWWLQRIVNGVVFGISGSNKILQKLVSVGHWQKYCCTLQIPELLSVKLIQVCCLKTGRIMPVHMSTSTAKSSLVSEFWWHNLTWREKGIIPGLENSRQAITVHVLTLNNTEPWQPAINRQSTLKKLITQQPISCGMYHTLQNRTTQCELLGGFFPSKRKTLAAILRQQFLMLSLSQHLEAFAFLYIKRSNLLL